MFDFKQRSYFLFIIGLCGLCPWQSAMARFSGEIDYGINAEYHTDRRNEISSIFDISLRDDFLYGGFEGQYNLDSSLFYDHKNNLDNQQHTGVFSGRYNFLKPSLRWEMDATIDNIPVRSGVEVDDFDSQTISTVSTGPVITLWKNLRGTIELKALYGVNSFSDSALGSHTEDISLIYNYPLVGTSRLAYSLNYQEVNYDDVINSESDFELSNVKIELDKNTTTLDYSFEVAGNEVESKTESAYLTTFDFSLSYLLNSNENISLALTSALQTETDFNAQQNGDDNAILSAVLVKNNRVQMGYGYAIRDSVFDVQLYSNQIKDVLGTVDNTGDIVGITLSFSNAIDEKINAQITFDSFKNELSNVRSDEIVAITNYTQRHSEDYTSIFELRIELQEVDNVRTDDFVVRYRFISNIFRY